MTKTPSTPPTATIPAATDPEALAQTASTPGTAATVPEASAAGSTNRLTIEEKVIDLLRTVYDPEIPVNIYELGLIYRIELNDDCTQLDVDMTLTAPNCPAADFLMEDVRQKLSTISELTTVNVNLVFEPEWNKDMISEEAQLELGLI